MSHDPSTSRTALRAIARRAMVDRGFLPDFSAAALKEAGATSEAGSVSADGEIRDLRPRLWASIDNDDSLDLDQLSVAERLSADLVKVFVAIADVDASVSRGSAIDLHARTNTTSVYTPVEIFPMLPERLSTDLTSLRQDVDRLAMVVEMSVQRDGAVGESKVYRAVVRNRAKLAYNSVAAWLEGKAKAPAALEAVAGLDEQLRLQDEVAQAMKRTRHERGALTLDTVEARAVFDGEILTGLRREEKNRAKELIEELMVAANGCTARFLEAQGFPSLRRMLRSPERWPRIVQLAAELGEKLPAEASAAALQQFLVRRREADGARFPDLSLSVIKLLGSGEYVMDKPGQAAEGHFGLAARDYTHSTAPNRRFPDLVTQRLLKAAIDRSAPPYTDDELRELARHCTEQEDDAAKIERQVKKSVAAALLASRVGQSFDAFVTGASSKGTWVRILEPVVEGKLTRGSEGADVGDRLRVRLVRTDVERGFIDFERVR
jgi:VacB/RNase II family 3'-5' exoribonuclease